MFQLTTECIGSLAIDDIAGQAVPESGTGRAECSVADSCTPHPRYLQSICPRWSEPMSARHVSYTDKVVDQILWSQFMQRSEDQHRQLELYALRRAQPVKAGASVSVMWSERRRPATDQAVALSTDWEMTWHRADQGGVPVVPATQYQRCEQRLINRHRDWTLDAAKFAQRSSTRKLLNLHPNGQVSINKDAKIAHAGVNW